MQSTWIIYINFLLFAVLRLDKYLIDCYWTECKTQSAIAKCTKSIFLALRAIIKAKIYWDVFMFFTVDRELIIKCDLMETVINPAQLPHHQYHVSLYIYTYIYIYI